MAAVVLRPAKSTLRTGARLGRSVGEVLSQVGDMLLFAYKVLYHAIFDIILKMKYRTVVFRQMSDVVVGAGAFLAGGGMVFVIAAMSLATGATLGLEGFAGLKGIGAESFTGLITSFGNVREVTPVVAGVALAAQVGAGFTAELGAMRISDEIDALEVMATSSLTYLVSTRLVAISIVLVPLYLLALFASFFGTRLITTAVFGLSTGVYDYYFNIYLPAIDIFYSLLKASVFAVVICLIHCYYGYYASGGPVGVGIGVGRAIRMSIIVVVLINLLLSFLLWGARGTVSLTG